MSEPTTYREMASALVKTEGWSVRSDLSGILRSWRVFRGNSTEFERLLASSEDVPRALELWAADNKEGFEEFLDDVDRLLHNYLAAAMSLRDHSRNVARRRLPDDAADNLAAEYRRRVESVFADSPLARFVQELRNKTLHHRLPVANGWWAIVPNESFQAGVVLETEHLLKLGDWPPAARRYIDEAGERIRLRDVVSSYTACVDELQEWLRGAIIERHRDKLRELEEDEAAVRERFFADAPATQEPTS